MARVKVKVENREIIDSGSVTIQDDQAVYFQIDNLTLKILFETVEGGTPASAQTAMESESLLVLKLINFNNPLGTSYIVPRLGSLDSLALGLNLTVHTVGSIKPLTQLINYTLLLGAEADGK